MRGGGRAVVPIYRDRGVRAIVGELQERIAGTERAVKAPSAIWGCAIGAVVVCGRQARWCGVCCSEGDERNVLYCNVLY